jgi:hypothetical protein
MPGNILISAEVELSTRASSHGRELHAAERLATKANAHSW